MFEELNEDLKKKAMACKTVEELTALAKAEGFELTEEMLDAVSGGIGEKGCIQFDWCTSYCQIYSYNGKGLRGDAYDCTLVVQSNPSALPDNCVKVIGV